MSAHRNLTDLLSVFKNNKTLLAVALATSRRTLGRWLDGQAINDEHACVIEAMLNQYRPSEDNEDNMDQVVNALAGMEVDDVEAPDANTVVEVGIARSVLLVEGYVQGQYILTVARSVENTDDYVRVLGEDGCLIIMSPHDNNVTVSRVPSTHERVQFYYRVQHSFETEYALYEIASDWKLKADNDISMEDIKRLRDNDIGENKMVILSAGLTKLMKE